MSSNKCVYFGGRAACAVVLVLLVAGVAQAGLVLNWEYYEATAELGQSETVMLSDFKEGMSAMAEVEDNDLGSTNAELHISQQMDAPDTWTIDISASLDMRVNENPGGAINFSRGATYFQLAVTVSDVPYMFELDYVLEKASDSFVTENDHFVCQYGGGTVLYPRVEPYGLIWGAMDYTMTGFPFPEWDYLCAHTETDLTLTLVQVPEPAAMSLLVLGGGLAMLRRRRSV